MNREKLPWEETQTTHSLGSHSPWSVSPHPTVYLRRVLWCSGCFWTASVSFINTDCRSMVRSSHQDLSSSSHPELNTPLFLWMLSVPPSRTLAPLLRTPLAFLVCILIYSPRILPPWSLLTPLKDWISPLKTATLADLQVTDALSNWVVWTNPRHAQCRLYSEGRHEPLSS